MSWKKVDAAYREEYVDPRYRPPKHHGSKDQGCDLFQFRDAKVIRKDSYWKIVE